MNQSQALSRGDSVVITTGPLHGLKGTLVGVDRQRRRVKVKLLQTTQLLDIALECITISTEANYVPTG